MELAALVLVLGFGVSLISGYLGIGGGILLAPALLYLPSLVGADVLTMREVSGLTMVQGLFACCSGAWRHDRYGCVNRRLVLAMGPAMAASALAGSVLARWVANEVLVLLFAGLAASAAVLMGLPPRDDERVPDAGPASFPVRLAVAIACAVGLLGGMVGQGGSFLLIPLMLHVLRLPTRVVIGSNLALVFFSSSAGLVGKVATGQVPPLLAASLLLGAVPAAQIGSALSRATPARSLRIALGVVVALGAIGMVADAVLALG